jgi:hypothetical protein
MADPAILSPAKTHWNQTRQTNVFIEALNGLFQAAKRRARGFTRMSTIKTMIFLIAGKLHFGAVILVPGKPLAFQKSQNTWNSTPCLAVQSTSRVNGRSARLHAVLPISPDAISLT